MVRKEIPNKDLEVPVLNAAEIEKIDRNPLTKTTYKLLIWKL
jgi:hypothetical protein